MLKNGVVLTVVAVLFALSASAGADPITGFNGGFEDRVDLGLEVPFFEGQDKYNQPSMDKWRHFEVDNNGGPLRLWNIGTPGVDETTNGIADVGFGGNAPEGDYVIVVRSRYNDDEFHDPPQVRDFEAAVQLLTETFDPTMTYTLTAKVGKMPSGAAEGGSVNYTPSWYGYGLQLAVGGTNVGGAKYAGRVEGGTIIAQDNNSLTVPVNTFVTSTVTYTPDPAHADLAGLPLQIRLAALEDPADHSLSGWVAFDDVTLDKSILNDYIWDADPANNGDWMLNPTNWEDDGPLTAADNAVIEQVGEGGTTGVLTVSTADAAASSLDVNHGTVDVTDTGLLTIAGDVTVVGGATLSVDGTLTAASINSSGTLSGSGTLTAATINSSGTLSGSGTINADPIDILGTIAPGGAGIGTLTLGSGEMGLDPLATFEAQVSLAVVGPIEADMSTTLVADQLVLDDEDTALQIGGTLAISSLGDRTDAGYWATSPVVIDNPLSGQIGDTGGLPYTGREFDAVTPAPPAPGEPALHLGQGLFLRPGAGVTYVRPGAAPTITEAVELDVLVALGGDADGDGKVWLSDWAALRANFGNTGTGKTWTEGNFDPWVDDKVWLSDWAALRANFGNADYTTSVAGAAAVPEPGTIAMLLGALAGLALMVRRRRAA